MTFEELKKKGYGFGVVHHSRYVEVVVRKHPFSRGITDKVGTVHKALRTEALEAARILAITHFVENRIAS